MAVGYAELLKRFLNVEWLHKQGRIFRRDGVRNRMVADYERATALRHVGSTTKGQAKHSFLTPFQLENFLKSLLSAEALHTGSLPSFRSIVRSSTRTDLIGVFDTRGTVRLRALAWEINTLRVPTT